MHVLVTWASKHGGTAGIGEAIATELRAKGLDVTALPVEAVGALDEFDAVVLGGAVYIGQWMKQAREFATRHRTELAARPLWLFSSGPIGEPLKPADEAVEIETLMAATGAREHRLFAGRIARQNLGFAEKAVVMALRVPDGDWRDWEEIRAWADSIAEALGQHGPAAAHTGYQPWAVGGRW
jgi:menaquinone-dependent protoporphyrinogen oxidase